MCVDVHLQTYFLEGPLIGLISFPSSGNTWLRYLLQYVTGYMTGSFYHSPIFHENGFPGESMINGSMLVIKSHYISW